jgi:4-hydroxybenzoate polyprenyltransferase
MNKIISFSKLIRLPNLLIIALAQYAVRWGIIYPMYTFLNKQLIQNYPDKITNPDIIHFQVSEMEFFFLSLATVMIAAAGYIINDYFDVKIDRINKPQQMIIDKGIKRRVAMGAHFVISSIAILIAMLVSFKLGLWQYGFIYIACAVGLWVYSTEFKKQFLIGNIIVALFVALVPFTVGLYELHLAVDKYRVLTLPPFEVNFKAMFNFIVGFSALAFLINFIREIIKDIEDMEGDKEFGCRTIPIVLGIDTARNMVSFLVIITMLIIGYVQMGQYQSGAIISFGYLLVFLQIPLAVIVYLLLKARIPGDFRKPDILSKVVMLTGILYTVVVYFSFMPSN